MSESLPPRRAFSVSRREFLGALGGVAAGAGLGSVAADSGPATAASTSRTEPFYGVHQGGIVNPRPDPHRVRHL